MNKRLKKTLRCCKFLFFFFSFGNLITNKIVVISFCVLINHDFFANDIFVKKKKKKNIVTVHSPPSVADVRIGRAKLEKKLMRVGQKSGSKNVQKFLRGRVVLSHPVSRANTATSLELS